MKTEDIVKKLAELAKKNPFPTYVDNDLLKAAAKRMEVQQDRIDALLTEIADKDEHIARLEEEISIMKEDEYDFPEKDDGTGDAAAPGEAAEDFWEDMWPT